MLLDRILIVHDLHSLHHLAPEFIQVDHLLFELSIVGLLELGVHCHLIDPANLLQEALVTEAVLLLQLAVAAWIKLGRVQYFAFSSVLIVFEDGVENALTDEEEANNFFGICVIYSVNFEARAVVGDVDQLDYPVPGEGEDWHSLVAVARREPVAPIDIR